MSGEVGIRPSLMIRIGPTKSRTLVLLAQDRAQPSSDEAVQRAELGTHGVLEVAKPAFEHRIEIADDPLQARTPASPRLAAHLVPDRFAALLAHEAVAPLEPVAQELEPLTRLSAVSDPRLVRMQCQTVGRHPRLDLAECGQRLGLRPA